MKHYQKRELVSLSAVLHKAAIKHAIEEAKEGNEMGRQRIARALARRIERKNRESRHWDACEEWSRKWVNPKTIPITTLAALIVKGKQEGGK